MNAELPLGGYPQFDQSTPAPWGGESSGWTITYGDGVVPDLVDGIRAHVEARRSQKFDPQAAVIGCVPWLTSADVANALARLEQCCIVIDKQPAYRGITNELVRGGNPLSSLFFWELRDVGVPDEEGEGPPPITPGSPYPDPIELGPVRLAGWQRDDRGRPRPMLHAKMLLIGVTMFAEGEYGEETPIFVPYRTWIGSANWTAAANSHLEYGLWCDDRALMEHNRKFLMNVIRFSEAWDSAAVGPEPQLVDREWDDEAFADYDAEFGGTMPDEEDEDPSASRR